MNERHFISVFRSTKNADTYVYVRRGHEWAQLPEALQTVFGRPEHAMDLVLTADRKLARVTGKDVLEAIEENGFFLQLPQEQDTYVVDFKRRSGYRK